MGEGMVISMDRTQLDMKLTMDLKDHSPIELTWAIAVNLPTKLQDMKLTNLKDHSPIELTWAKWIMVNFNGPSFS
jgi:hypothetical protein